MLLLALGIPFSASGLGAAARPPENPLAKVLRAAQEEGGLPLGFAFEVAPRLRLQIHPREDFLPAHFAPAPLRPLEEDPDVASLPEGPTLYLYGEVYAPEGRWKEIEELPVDSAEGLFNALLLAYFELEVLPSDSSFRRALVRHARERLPELAAEDRIPAFVQGLADFGSHVLTVANQLNLLEARSRQRGKDLCPLLENPATLFGLWNRIFEDGVYLARFYRSAEGDEVRGRWVETSQAITREDKQMVLLHVFGDAWAGTRQQDLAPRFCTPATGAKGSEK